MEGVLEDEERLVQMVQDFIESSPSSSTSSWAAANHGSFFSSSPSDDDRHSEYLATFLREILEEKETGAEADVLESVMKLMRRRRRRRRTKGSSSNRRNCSAGLRKWIVLGLQMEGYPASLCQTSWVTSLGCPGGDYEYIDVLILDDSQRGEHLHRRLIVDVDFKSQFEVARPTPAYKQLTNILPAVFVGSESKLNRIISILCSAAEKSLRERGLHIPPWRSATYMQSKWLSTTADAKCHLISGPPAPPATASSSSDRNNDEDNDDDDDHIVKSSKVLLAPPPPTPVSNGSTVGVKGKRRGLRGGSALSSQFSNVSINCC